MKLSAAIAFVGAVMPAVPAAGATIRYAIVVGTDVGVDPEEGRLPELLHAEEEARRLYGALLDRCNFAPEPTRTILLERPTKSALFAAVETVARQIEADRKAFGEFDALFGFFFTGHGLSGRLLVADGAIERADLGRAFQRIEADLELGVFDACYSGSLSDELVAKGVRPTPGLNVLVDLPQEILNAEGSLWFVSSAPNQLSYEDREFGGVFTHYFTEALEKAERDGPAITLERIWHYAQGKTVEHTTRRGRAQHPQQLVTKLKASGPLFFSFPSERDAILELGPSVEGSFLLTYDDAGLSEIIEKRRGAAEIVRVYPGRSRLLLARDGRFIAERMLSLEPGDRALVSNEEDSLPGLVVGEQLLVKGEEVSVAVAPSVERLLFIDVAYEHALGRSLVLAPSDLLSAGIEWQPGGVLLEGRIGWGHRSRDYVSWGYDLHAATIEGRAGFGFHLHKLRIATQLAITGGALWQRFRDGESRRGFMAAPSAVLSVLHPLTDLFALEVFLRGGAEIAPGIAQNAGLGVSPLFAVGASVSMRIE